ncbi:Trp biosynthesis-associated membrane protein [Actinokineospora iranica]|uniref:Trp region conserved hypothetical membrane protein n=1 Tax=Actinokineospora iranica TaxID=1271860 RepID=A0A1G6KBV1_9PSEU|nr:Trp biosynthesis-associated membrane protein [Actinokineospora iranica]SDC28358.1 trp region conserved hypothetical membrane protein [Actinokineospora iranica]
MAERDPWRPLWIVVALLPAAAAALWGASRLAWGSAVRSRPGTDATVTVDVPGAELAPALVPLALVALAAVAGVLALGGLPRRVLGAVVALTGMAPIWTGLFTHSDTAAFGGRALALAGGALMVAAGILLLLRGHRMPRLGGKYKSPGAAKESARTEQDLWQALSEGEDPTAPDR